MTLAELVIYVWNYLKSDTRIILGTIISAISLFLLLSELYTKIKHGTTSENMVLSFIGLTFGLILVFLQDWLIAIALSFFVLALYQTWQLRESPVWRELMITSVATYFVFLAGTVADKVYEIIKGEETEIFTGWAYNLMIYVFLIMALIFFGKKFVLVTRFMSPQILYLTLFAFAYAALWTVGKFIPGFDNLTFNYLPINPEITKRVIFLSFGPYEIIILLSFALYFISGWLLDVLLGIKPTDDPRLHRLVNEVKEKLGIKRNIKIGVVKAPILNAMAYGPFFDQRVAFISSDINDFSDDDIRGIVAHELAHNKRGHIIWLQVIASLEMIIKKAFLLPATTLDYAVIKDLMPFALYFLISYGIIAILYIFVRILEGDADRLTKKVGYGKELAQALYKLEGFYQGIAGDFGLNVQLLTGKEFTEAEKLRFRGEAAITLYRNLYRPGRWSMFANIFMSHPRTAYRIVSVVDDDLSPVKGALLPYWLLLPSFIRNKALKKLTLKRDSFDKLISERFQSYYGKEGVKEFLDITRTQELSNIYLGKHIVAYDRTTDTVIEGTVKDLKISESICRPLLLVLNTNEGIREILATDFEINEAQKGDMYILKDGRIGILDSWTKKEKSNRPIFTFINEVKGEKKFKSYITGKSTNYLKTKVNSNVFLYRQGLDRVAQLKEANFRKTMESTTFTFELEDEKENKTITVKGNDVIIELPPVLLRFKANEKSNKQDKLLEELKEKSCVLYAKEELEVGIACKITKISEEHVHYELKGEENKIKKKKLEYITVYADIPKFFLKKHLSMLDRFLIWWSNKKEMKYIYP
ncbi:MAG: M48 family metalloprotease [Candidatus Heimdallarchaeaceae archaeon]